MVHQALKEHVPQQPKTHFLKYILIEDCVFPLKMIFHSVVTGHSAARMLPPMCLSHVFLLQKR